MEVLINRNSVCMGDDIEDHRIAYNILPSMTFSDLFKELIAKGYFPSVSGNDVVWTLLCDGEDIMTYKTQENKLYGHFIDKGPKIVDVKRWQDIKEIYFRYYSSPLKRAKAIFIKFNGQKAFIGHEGFYDEYKSYGISLEMEEQWLEEIGLKCR